MRNWQCFSFMRDTNVDKMGFDIKLHSYGYDGQVSIFEGLNARKKLFYFAHGGDLNNTTKYHLTFQTYLF